MFQKLIHRGLGFKIKRINIVQFDNSIRIDKKEISKDKPPYIVAEAGVSHFGSLKKALKLCDLAKESGADSVKFQIFNVDKFH